MNFKKGLAKPLYPLNSGPNITVALQRPIHFYLSIHNGGR